MAQLTEKAYTGEWLKWSANRDFCLDVVTLKSATVQTIVSGCPLETDGDGLIIVANGKEGDVIAIAMENVVAAGSEKILALVRGPAIVDPDKMTFAASVTWAELAAALAALDIRPAQAELAEWLTQTY